METLLNNTLGQHCQILRGTGVHNAREKALVELLKHCFVILSLHDKADTKSLVHAFWMLVKHPNNLKVSLLLS